MLSGGQVRLRLYAATCHLKSPIKLHTPLFCPFTLQLSRLQSGPETLVQVWSSQSFLYSAACSELAQYSEACCKIVQTLCNCMMDGRKYKSLVDQRDVLHLLLPLHSSIQLFGYFEKSGTLPGCREMCYCFSAALHLENFARDQETSTCSFFAIYLPKKLREHLAITWCFGKIECNLKMNK